MPCYHPIPAELEWIRYAGQTPKKYMKLHPEGEPTHWLPCQKCLGCREIQQQQLALRITHEATAYTHNHFLTLTYEEEKLPRGLQKHHMQNFWKKLRKQTTHKIKHLTCGEYGDRTQRPHYHAAVLNLAIADLKKWDSENNRSNTLEKLWAHGIVTVSELTPDRIKYVAGYVLKKAGYRKQIYCTEDGEELQGPYRNMSKGLGKEWLKKYATDLRNGYLQQDQSKYTIPRYYLDYIKKTNTQLHDTIEQAKTKNWKELTYQDRQLLHNAEKIRQKQIKDRKARDQI